MRKDQMPWGWFPFSYWFSSLYFALVVGELSYWAFRNVQSSDGTNYITLIIGKSKRNKKKDGDEEHKACAVIFTNALQPGRRKLWALIMDQKYVRL